MGEARAVMDRGTERFFGGDVEGAKALYASDAIGVGPDGTEYKGGHEIVEYVAGFLRSFPDATFEPIGKYEDGHTAIDEGMFIGTNTGPLWLPNGQTLPPTGRRVVVRVCDMVTVESGLITAHRMYFDQMSFLAQLGLAPI